MQPPAMYHNCPLELTADIWLAGNYFFNLYLVRGTQACALVEMGVTAVVDAAISQLDSLGVSPDYLVLAHPHTDHITGLPGLVERYPKAQLLAGAGARDFALHPKALPGMVHEDRHITARLSRIGLPAARSSLTTLPMAKKRRSRRSPSIGSSKYRSGIVT